MKRGNTFRDHSMTHQMVPVRWIFFPSFHDGVVLHYLCTTKMIPGINLLFSATGCLALLSSLASVTPSPPTSIARKEERERHTLNAPGRGIHHISTSTSQADVALVVVRAVRKLTTEIGWARRSRSKLRSSMMTHCTAYPTREGKIFFRPLIASVRIPIKGHPQDQGH